MGKKQHPPQKPGRSKPPSSSSVKSTAKSRTARPAPPGEEGGKGGRRNQVVADDTAQETRHHQALLDAFSSAFGPVLRRDDFASVLQEVKGALFNRDFEGAFNNNKNHGAGASARQGEEEEEGITTRDAKDGDGDGDGEDRGSAGEAGAPDFLAVYAARWSPTRALCYGRILRRDLAPYLRGLLAGTDHDHDGDGTPLPAATAATQSQSQSQPLRALCIGGGAAELAAFASYLALPPTDTTTAAAACVRLTLLDTGPWGPVARRLSAALTTPTPPALSRYYARSASASAAALVAPPERLGWAFERGDVLGLGEEALRGLLLLVAGAPGRGQRGEEKKSGEGEQEQEQEEQEQASRPMLVTLLFTLNELYASEGGVGRTTAFLRRLGLVIPPGSLLLVVDSPGSYSEAAVGREDGMEGGGGGGGSGKKRYPMQWLLDHTLLRVPEDEDRKRRNRGKKSTSSGHGEGEKQQTETGRAGGCRWEKLESHDSVWFRLAEGLRYPIALENMRYQMHLYRACAREV
ncbi:hypothetical protein F4809DRAFT_654884 [Biscogniauxia mediterranea]|nr:hypothetical protein F4809DRAFT_654884 [Biscogniauxia mediterranea]